MSTNDNPIKAQGWVVVELRDKDGNLKQRGVGRNVITTAGLVYYAQRGAEETPTNFNNAGTFDGVAVLGTAGATPAASDNYSDMTPISGTPPAASSGYPKTNDTDAANTGTTGTTTVTYKYFFAAGNFTDSAVAEVCISDPSPSGTDPLLMRATLANGPYNKTASDTLTVFINHTLS